MQGNLSSSLQLERYRQLTELAYIVLRHCQSLPVVSVSVMNPRHPLPPEDLELSRNLESGTDAPRMAALAREWARCLVNALRETVRILRLRWEVGSLPGEVGRQPADILMKTWVFGAASLSNGADFYYGRLPQMLQQRDISCVLLCGDASGSVKEQGLFARKALSQERIRYVPEKLLMPVWAPLVTAFNQLLTSLKLRRLGKKVTDKKLATVLEHASLECLRPFTTATSLYFYIARRAVKTWRAKVFMTLYEGQTWEKPAWIGAKAADRNCVTVGYQHTVVMPHSLSLISPNNGSGIGQTPDCVLCLGEATRKMMEPGHRLKGTRFVPFGSFRRAPGSSSPRLPKPGRCTIVVVPEGLFGEAKLLFNAAIRVALSARDHRFILRCHPILPFERVRPQLEQDPAGLPNVEVSEAPIESDFARSSVVLYRGSSSVFYAVLYGLKPVYLHDDMHPDVDPLFELRSWREYASSASEIAVALGEYARTTEELAGKAWQEAVRYVNSYTTAVDEASVDRFLASVGLHGGKVS